MKNSDNNMYSEAILSMLSEMNKKLDAIQVNCKAKEIQPANQEVCQSTSLEDIEELITAQARHVGKFVEKTHKMEVEKLNFLITATPEFKKQIKALPVPEKVSLNSLIDLLSKRKKVTICGFDFLKTSVVIFVLTLISFFSVVLNIKQRDDCRALKSKYSKQTEYILQMEESNK